MLARLGGLRACKEDLSEAIDELRRLYQRKVVEYSITGEPILAPYPIIKVGKRLIRGNPIRASSIRSLVPYPHCKRVLAIDASIKLLLDCGPFKIVVSKVAWGVWRGVKVEITEEPIIRVKVIRDKQEAAEWLLKVELSEAFKRMRWLRRGDYLLLDRGLMAVPALRRETRELFEKVDLAAERRGVILIGLSKVSRLRLSDGASLLGYLSRLAHKYMGEMAWYYYPLFRESQLPSWYIGDISIAKLSDESNFVFRVDVSRRALRRWELGGILGELAYLQDPALPGYPYPLKSVHDSSKIGHEELELMRLSFMELADKEGIGDRLRADVEAYSFKEEVLWGSLG